MKKTIKDLYDIEAKAFIKYSDKVYKIKNDNDEEYCLKYIDNTCNNNLIEKINTLKLNDSFIMPLKTCIRSNVSSINNKNFLITKWVEDDMVDSKDLKLKYYLSQIGQLHNKTSYTLNVSNSYFKEITMKLDEDIKESFQYYENIISSYEKNEYKSPFMWYFIEQYKNIVESLNKANEHLEKFKSLVKDRLVIRQVITHQNFSYDHVFVLKDKIIGNDKISLKSPVYDFVSLFEKVDFGSIDISGLIDEYNKYNSLEDYEIQWLLSSLFKINIIHLTSNELENINDLLNLLFKHKSVVDLENKLEKK